MRRDSADATQPRDRLTPRLAGGDLSSSASSAAICASSDSRWARMCPRSPVAPTGLNGAGPAPTPGGLTGTLAPGNITGPDGLLQRLTKRLVERAMDTVLSERLGYDRGQAPPGGVGNARSGTSENTVHTDRGSVSITQPRDRAGSFETADRPQAPAAASPASTSGSSRYTSRPSRGPWLHCCAAPRHHPAGGDRAGSGLGTSRESLRCPPRLGRAKLPGWTVEEGFRTA